MTISDQAIIDPTAEIDSGVEIGPWTHIGPRVRIGKDTKIGSHVVIKENTTMGANNVVHPFASIGGDPQVKAYTHHDSFLEIGDHNVFHEYATISRGDISGTGVTKIGNHNLFMACTHVAHDCIIHDSTIFVNNAAVAGHVEVQDFVVLGAYCAVHQFCHIGMHSFLSRGAMVAQDVVPYTMVVGNPPKVCGINKVGLSRRGFSKDQIANIMYCYKAIFRRQATLAEAIKAIEIEIPEPDASIKAILEGLRVSERGIVR